MQRNYYWGAIVALMAGMVCADVDWTALNLSAREQAKTPIRAGVPGKAPFWNEASRAFIHPPAFAFKEVPAAVSYRYTLSVEKRHPAASEGDVKRRDAASPLGDAKRRDVASPLVWTESVPWVPLRADIWDGVAPGYCSVKVEGLDVAGTVVGVAGERKFYRAAVFKGPYPAAKTDYRTAAKRVYASVYNLPQVQGWMTNDDPPKGYDLYCYPAKILSSMIRALVRHAKYEPKEAQQALAIARKMSDWLIAHSQPADAALPAFPPTYWGNRRGTAAENAGLNMLLYPAHAANAYFDLVEATGEAKYREAALAIARTYVKIQGADGTWPLKVREKDGSPTRANRLVPGRYILRMFDQAWTVTKDAAFATARDRAFAFVENGPVRTWNWDGQFEDVDPLPPYHNLQKGNAIDTAYRLFAQGDVKTGCELVDWCEDQFTVWSDPIHHMDWTHWKMPTALEQYEYYTPIDASMADMIGGLAAAYAATKNPLYREKAKALADNITRHQRANGSIPTYFDNRGGSDWVNCMVYAADRLEFLADIIAVK